MGYATMEKHDFAMFVHCGKVLDRLVKLSGELEDIRRDLIDCRYSIPDSGQIYDFMWICLFDMAEEIRQARDNTEKKYCELIDERNKRYKEICNKSTCEKQT